MCYICVLQANIWCTAYRADKIATCLIMFTLVAQAVIFDCVVDLSNDLLRSIFTVVIYGVVPATILIINLIVVYKVRRSSHYAATNLGLQQHQQSTSSSSAVPTVTLVTTSLVYVALCGMWSVLYVIFYWIDKKSVIFPVLLKCMFFAEALLPLVFAYNFFVYLVTSKRFRSDLHILFSRCSSSSSVPISAATRVTRQSQLSQSVSAV